GPVRLVEGRVVLALAAAGQLRGTDGVVAVLDPYILGQLRLGMERLGAQPGRGAMELLLIAELGEGQGFSSVGGLELPCEDFRELAVELHHALGLAYPLRGGIAPVGLLRAQLVTPFQFDQRLGELALEAERSPQVATGLRGIRLETEGLAKLLDR